MIRNDDYRRGLISRDEMDAVIKQSLNGKRLVWTTSLLTSLKNLTTVTEANYSTPLTKCGSASN